MSTERADRVGYERGLTWRSTLALVFSSAIILPVGIYMQLVSGIYISGAAIYITAILFAEMSILLGAPLTKQEIFIVFSMAGTAGTTASFMGWIQNEYYLNSPIASAFTDAFTGKPLPEAIPYWWAPPLSSGMYVARSFFNPALAIPLAIAIINGGFLWITQEIALTMLSAYIFTEVQPLTFPFADVNAQLVTTLAERPRAKMQTFVVSTIISFVISFVMYGIPVLAQGGLGILNFYIIPIPWIDLTTGYYGIEKVLPGGMLGFATDPTVFATGFVLNVSLLIYIAIGSLAIWLVGNNLALTVFGNSFPGWVQDYHAGMNISAIMQRSILRIWLFPFVGFALALTVMTIASSRRNIVESIKSLAKASAAKSRREKGYFSLRTILIMYLVGTGGSVAMFYMLVPDFPIWITILSTMGLGLAFTLASTRSIGEAATSIPTGQVWYGVVLFSGYPKVDAFLFTPNIGGSSAPGWVQSLRTAELTQTRPMDFYKSYLVAAILYNVFSFIYVQFFWSISQIPSALFPYTVLAWPTSAIQTSLFLSRQIAINTNLFVYSFIAMSAVGIVGGMLPRMGIPFSFTGLVVGTTTIVPFALTQLLGGLVGKYVIRRLTPVGWWDANKAVVVAGIGTGEGLVVGIFAGLVLMMRSVWTLPF